MPPSQPPALPPQQESPPPVEPPVTSSADRLLQQLLVFTVVLIATWIVAVSSYGGSAGTVSYLVVTTFGMIYPLHLIMTGVAIHARIKRQGSIRLTAMVALAPWVTLPVPFLLNRFNPQGPLLDSPQKLTNTISLLVVAGIAAVILQPRRYAYLLPTFLLKNFGLNLLILLATISLYLVPVALLLFNWTELSQAKSPWGDGYLLVYGLGALTTYLIATAFPAVFVLGYSALSLFQDQVTAHRKWRIAQLVTALPLVLVGGGMFITLLLRTK